jgi:hypothetical protein
MDTNRLDSRHHGDFQATTACWIRLGAQTYSQLVLTVGSGRLKWLANDEYHRMQVG